MLAAVRIADAEGLAALSMRRVAADLGTATMSLYRHVRNKDELLFAMTDNVFARYPLPPATPDWRAGLESLCRLQWRGYQDHPWLAQYVSMTRPQLVPRAMAHTERAMSILAGMGLDIADRLHMAVTLANYVRGTAVSLEPEAQARQDTGMTNDEWMETQVPLMTEIVSSGEYPMFVAMATADNVELSLDSLFEFGLARLLDGLEAFVQSGAVRRRDAPSPARHRRLRHHLGFRLRVVLRQPGAPLEVADQRGPELRVVRQRGVVGGQAHQRREPEPLLGGDPQVPVMGEHPFVPAEPLACTPQARRRPRPTTA